MSIEKLKNEIQSKIKKNVADFNVWLQDEQKLEPSQTLVEQCVNGEGWTVVYTKIDHDKKRINIDPLPSQLPIEDDKEAILKVVKRYNVVVLHDPTGCGRTTEVPQFILDDYRQNCCRSAHIHCSEGRCKTCV